MVRQVPIEEVAHTRLGLVASGVPSVGAGEGVVFKAKVGVQLVDPRVRVSDIGGVTLLAGERHVVVGVVHVHGSTAALESSSAEYVACDHTRVRHGWEQNRQ